VSKDKPSGIQISPRGKLIWGALIVFIAGWMFVLGIIVGRGMAPVNLEVGKLEKELSDLKAKMLDQQKSEVEAQLSGKKSHLPVLGYPEALTSSKKQEPFKSLPMQPPEKARKTTEVEKAPIKKPAAEPKPAPKPRSTPAPKPAPAVKPVASSKPKEASGPKPSPRTAPQKGRFSIQVAAVQDTKGAEQLAARLRKQGYQAYQVRSDVTGKGVWYRVRVGAFEDRGAADRMLAKLKADHFGGMVVGTP
jgi:cell division septation protein DedD